MIRTPSEIETEVERLVGRGLTAAAIHLSTRVKEIVSVPAPRVRVISGRRSRNPGQVGYRAATPATPGAPPRKLTGRLRASIAYEVSPGGRVARVGTNVIYARSLIHHGHDFLRSVLVDESPRLARIIGQNTQAL